MTMTNEELVAQIQAGVDVQNNMGQLYEQNQGLIAKFVYPFHEYAEMDDLMQEAFFGMRRAVDNYIISDDGALFMSYAKYSIVRQCFRYVNAGGKVKRLPENMVVRISKYKKYYRKCMTDAHERPTEQMVMDYMQLSKVQYDTMMRAIIESECISTSQAIGEDGLTIEDVVADSLDLEANVVDEAFQEQLSDELWDEVKTLDEKQQTVLVDRYKGEKTLEAIASDIGVTKERIRQIEKKALKALSQKEKLIRLAEEVGYDCNNAYHRGVNTFQNTNTSATEWVALKHLEAEKRMKKVDDEIHELMSKLYS